MEFLDPGHDPEWNQQVSHFPDATPFHTAAWARVLNLTYGHRPFYVRQNTPGGAPLLLPLMEARSWLTGRRGISLPFSDFCDPLAATALPNDVLPALEQIARERRWKHLELRGQGIVPADTPAAVTFYAHRLDLRGGTDAVASRFRPSVRQAQRKAERHGLTVTLERSQGAMRAFYRLHLLTRKRHGMPTQPWKFFNHIQTEMLASGLGFIALATLGVQPVAAAVFFHFARTGLYKYGASDAQVQEHRPNQLAMAAGISHLAELGIETLHFGRTSFANAGLRRFKQSWGATEELLSYYRLNLRSQGWETARDRSEGLHTRIFRHLPIGLNRLAGHLLYPHLD